MGYHANPDKWIREANDNLADRVRRLEAENETLRNELCIKCGQFQQSHKGACDGCRWKV